MLWLKRKKKGFEGIIDTRESTQVVRKVTFWAVVLLNGKVGGPTSVSE